MTMEAASCREIDGEKHVKVVEACLGMGIGPFLSYML
jgi:hypothetical protein